MQTFDFEVDQNGERKRACRIAGVVIGVLAVLAGLAALTAWLVLRQTDLPPTVDPYPETLRIDCYPEAASPQESPLLDEASCQARRCAYSKPSDPNAPYCYIPQDGKHGFSVLSGPTSTTKGFRYLLEPKGDGPFGPNVKTVAFDVELLSDDLVRFKFDDADSDERYKVPLTLNVRDTLLRTPRYHLQVYQTDPFAFKLMRVSSGTIIWDTGVGGLVFSDQYLQIATRLPSANVYGFGENVHSSLRHDMNFRSWPLFARDQPPGENENPLYSVHPFYECLEMDGNSHGVFLLNSNAMEYAFTPAPMLTYRTIGGILDFYVVMGPTPEMVIQQYTELIGRPYMPPYWALGFQISRYGYQNVSEMREAMERTVQYGIPVDVQYADIDHMEGARDFTIDEKSFGTLPEYFNELHAAGMRAVIILDPCFEINATYPPYVKGKQKDIYIKWPSRDVMPEGDFEEYNNTDMMGFVWPKWKVVFPDFFDPRTGQLWTDLLVEHRRKLKFDGIWIDMNEPANFDTNNEKAWNWPHGPPYWTLKCPESKWDDPPYRSKAAYQFDNKEKKTRLSDKTLCMQGTLANGTLRHYDVHSLYGHVQTQATLKSLRASLGDKRGMVITRSSFPGTGSSAGRWLGDNNAAWRDLQLSIIGILEFNLFGIPYIGADVCGFFNPSPPELCKRWMQLGAFYTFDRNHNHQTPPVRVVLFLHVFCILISGIPWRIKKILIQIPIEKPQDPGYYGDEVALASRDALRTRYLLLPYLYTLFHKAHTAGHTVIRPLHHEFPRDNQTWAIDRQFMWGPALLISPILEEGQTKLKFYLPAGQWYDFYSGQMISEVAGLKTGAVSQDSPIPLQIRGGHILPTQQPANNTQFSRQMPFALKVALDSTDGAAYGELFWDDGESIDTFENNKYYLAVFKCEKNKLTARVEVNGIQDIVSDLRLTSVEVLGVSDTKHLSVNTVSHTNFTLTYQVLTIHELDLRIDTGFTIEWGIEVQPNTDDSRRLDCCPGTDACNATVCGARGCTWLASDAPRVPWCFMNQWTGYRLMGVRGERMTLQRTGRFRGRSVVGGDVNTIVLSYDDRLDHMFRIKVLDPSVSRFEVPVPLNLPTGNISGQVFDFQTRSLPFSFTLRRKNGPIIWDTSIGGLTFADQFLQIAAFTSCRNLYGFGEHLHRSYRHDWNYRTWPFFTRDQGPAPEHNLYGVHPFYLCVEEDGKAHGVLLLNSHAMEVSLLPAPALVYRTTGGILDIYFIAGDNPEDVVRRYHKLVGLPFFPPYWALGFQLSRYGYNSIENLKTVVERNLAAQLPYDVQHLDIDTFDERKDFTVDKVNFKGLAEYITQIRTKGIRSFMILDPFLISNETDYHPYNLGLERDVFIKWPPGGSPEYDINKNDNLLGWCWPKGRVVFPDFFHPNTSDFWKQLIVNYYKDEITFDGIWIDMNDPANFGTNGDRAFNWPEDDKPYWTLTCPQSTWDDPPFKPKSVKGDRLSDKTICMNTLQAQGRYRHYDVHNLYGWSQTPPTIDALQQATNKRSMVVSRSTYPSSGKYAGHWLGDNVSIWPNLKDSIAGILDFNLFGIPYVGADICGYFSNATYELCQRWQQLGAFYTFSRNHQGMGNQDQDPASYGGEMLASTRHVLQVRYTLLPYLYTLFYKVHTEGGTVLRPLLHEFHDDPMTLEIERQFMWGPALLISPVLEEGKYEVQAYIPSGRWFNYYDGAELPRTGTLMMLPAPLDLLPLHVRGGHILPTQEHAVSTVLSRQRPFGLIVAPDASGYAVGTLFWDDGETIDTIEKGLYNKASFSADYPTGSVSMTIDQSNFDVSDTFRLGTVRLFAVDTKPKSVTKAGENVKFSYDQTTKELLLRELDLLWASFTIKWTS